jgi:hypothetical protein
VGTGALQAMRVVLVAASRPAMEVVQVMATAGEAVVAVATEPRSCSGYFQRSACFSTRCHDSPASANVITVVAST